MQVGYRQTDGRPSITRNRPIVFDSYCKKYVALPLIHTSANVCVINI